MDDDLSHAMRDRFEALEARVDALEGNASDQPSAGTTATEETPEVTTTESEGNTEPTTTRTVRGRS